MKEIIYFSIILLLFVIFFFLSVLHESIYISIFFLISLFLLSSFLFLMSGLEFVGFLYLIVYVGAVAVLFLFMVMLFDRTEYIIFNRDLVDETTFFSRFLMVFVAAFLVEFGFDYAMNGQDEPTWIHYMQTVRLPEYMRTRSIDPNLVFIKKISFSDSFSNIEAVGVVLYDYFFIALLGASLVLLLGMLGAIILTQNVNIFGHSYRHQEIKDQLVRRNRK